MTVITLDQAKHQLRLCGNEEDQHLSLLIEAAVEHASQYIDRPIPWLNSDGEEVPVPSDLKLGILLILSDLYENREGQFVGVAVTENQAVQNLLHFHRVGLGI